MAEHLTCSLTDLLMIRLTNPIAEPVVDGKPHRTAVSPAPAGGHPPGAGVRRATDLTYVDDDLAPDPPEFVPGQSPNLGFYSHGMDELEKGVVYFDIVGCMIENYTPGVEQDYLYIMDRPVRRIVASIRD